MANSLNAELNKRVVVIESGLLAEPYNTLVERLYYVEGGFGAYPFTSGNALNGVWCAGEFKGVSDRMEGYNVERFATRDEIAQYCPEYLSTLLDAAEQESENVDA